jgi:hypothetical protein
MQPGGPLSPRAFVPLPGAAWTPAPDTTDLAGQPLAANDREWFASPPPEIGDVVAAWSTQRAGSSIWPTWLKLMILLIVAVGAVFLANAIANASASSNKERASLAILLTCFFLPIAPLIAAAMMRWKHRIYFIGGDGVAKVTYKGDLASAKVEMLAFKDAMALRSSQTRHYHNGIYAGTNYDYNWYAYDAHRLLRLKGSFYGRKKAEKSNSPYRFALGAQAMWNRHYFARAVAELERTGGVTFAVGKTDSIRILRGALQLNFRGEQMQVTPTEIAKISLANGLFTIHHKDAGWFSRKGKFSFRYGSMSNGQVFLMLMERLVGYRLT